jgi:ribosome-associated heat shock protein Hsp15
MTPWERCGSCRGVACICGRVAETSEIVETSIRIDKYLWHVRLAKTRSQATQACQSGEVRMQGERVKPSRMIGAGHEFEMRRAGAMRSYRVVGCLNHRVAAKEVPQWLEETTAPEVLEALAAARADPAPSRDRGMGRPTKRDLRLIEKLFS